MPLEKLAEHFEEQEDWERADSAHRFAIMLDPDLASKVTNYAALLIDLKKYREAYTLLKPVTEADGHAYGDATILLREIESSVGKELPRLWDCEPLDTNSVAKATAEELKHFLEGL